MIFCRRLRLEYVSELTVWFLGVLYEMFCLGFVKWSKLKKGHLLIVVKKLGSWA